MQPSPRAETSRLLFPSLRCCIGPPDVLLLLVADLFHPVHDLAIEVFLNGEVRHGGGWRGAVPMLLTGRDPDHVTGPDLLDRPSPALRAAAAGGHDQGLAQRGGVPCPPGARAERHTCAGPPGPIGGLDQKGATSDA